MCWHRLCYENLIYTRATTHDMAAKVSTGDLNICSTNFVFPLPLGWVLAGVPKKNLAGELNHCGCSDLLF